MDDEEAARRIQTGQIDMDRLILASAYPGLRALLNEVRYLIYYFKYFRVVFFNAFLFFFLLFL